ncbi:hypothetical protein LTR84_008038 [Exophiala bonariae]|uniref:DUF4048 domain-containing protein n=1 Tax=Exophiala bonariae TaxID=1690606 RepID=A0AAV9NLV7_9EURO|nr:hypothetical protein LTR84_008038 [Exophiala bonariae]
MDVRPASPTHAFDPSPALAHDLDNFSPLNQEDTAMGSLSEFDGNDASAKNVRFTQNLPMHGRHSIATTHVPLLPPVASASQLPKHSFSIHNPVPGVDISAYIDQCRRLNTQLRETHESERRVWDIERTALKARIKELEQKINRARDPKRRSSNDSSAANRDSFRTSFASYNGFNGPARGRILSEPATHLAQPVWKGPEFTPPVTRVFSHDDDIAHLPSISENAPLAPLTKEVSPTSQERAESIPVPIEQVDKTLDGITLRSTALTSSFNKVASPQFISPVQSPSPRPKHPADGLMQVEIKGLLSPLDEKLKRHAGHTPMAFDGTVSSSASSERITPRQEKPYAPVPTRRPPLRPSENSDSYFSFSSEAGRHTDVKDQIIQEEPEMEEDPVHATEEDPALTGPLMLDPGAKSEASSTFLGLVDAKLSEAAAARRSRKDSLLSNGSQDTGTNGRDEASSAQADNDGPKLRVRNSTNFGSAWGQDAPGCS